MSGQTGTGDRPRLGVLIASTRPGRTGEPVGRWVEKEAKAHGHFDVQVLDLKAIDLPLLDEPMHPRLRKYTKEHTRAWSRQVDAVDAFVFVTPEYNFSMSGALKNALDFLFWEWQYKPVGFVSYGGVSGGTRGVQATKQVVTTLKMMPVAESVTIPFVANFVRGGTFEPSEVMHDAAQAMLDEVARWEAALRDLRRSVVAPAASLP